MKTNLTLTSAVYALLISSALASPTWYTGDYDPATWEPAAVNAIRGIEAYTGPSYYGGDNHGQTTQSTVPLTDGSVPGANINIADIVGVTSGDIKWNFAEAANLSEIRLYSRWFDGGRDGIHIKRVAYKVAGGDNNWIDLAGDSNRIKYGLDDNNTSGALYAILKEPDGSFLCENAIALYVQFSGAQDNNGTGYVEIEAVSESAAPTIACEPSATRVAATLAGSFPSVGTSATSANLSYAVAPHGEALPAYTLYGTSFVRGADFSIPVSGLRWDTEYDYALRAVNNEGEETVLHGTFRTQPEECAAITAGPGLWEVRYDGNGHDWTPDVWAIEEGLDVHQRHRELGAEMAYQTKSHTSAINNQTYSWINNSVYAYVGYIYLQGNAGYIFQSSIDDYAYIKIGDSFVHDSPGYSARYRTTLTTGDAGWYPIEIRLGDAGGGCGPFNGDPGLCYSIDNGATWNTFMDPGDGSFLRSSMVKPLTILSVVNTGTALRLEVSFSSDIAGCPLTACTAETYGTETASAWTTTALDAIGATETYRSFTLPYAAGTEFVRFFVTFNGADYWSETLVLDDYAAVDPAAPTLTFGEVLSTTPDSATLTANVVNTGDGHTTCDLVLAYGTDPSSLTRTNVFAGKATGTATVTLGGLMPNRTYYATFRAENASASSAETDVFTFQTPDLALSAGPYLLASHPGLWQGVFTNDTEGYTDNTGKYDLVNADSVNREPGAVMAYINNRTSPEGHTCAFDGVERTFKWTGDTTYAYSGYIWLDATEYVFGSYFWDYVFLKIGDDVLFNQKIDWGVPVRSRTYEVPGWYRFELRGSNRGNEGDPASGGSSYGGAGDCYVAGANIAISFSTNSSIISIVKPLLNGGDPGINGSAYPMREVTWSQFVDDGSGTFLRTTPPLRTIAVETLSTAGGTLSADLAFGSESEGAYELRIAYGATRGTEDPASWDATASVETIAADTDTYAYAGLTGAGTDVKYARFYFTDGQFVQWGDDLYLPDPADVALSTLFSVDAHLGDTLLLSGGLASSGAGATADVSALVATQADFSDAIVWPLGSFAAGDAITNTLHEADTAAADYIQPGATYYVALVAESANGEKDRTPTAVVTMPAGADISSTVDLGINMWTATFGVTVRDAGAGDGTTVTLLTGPSADALTNTASVVVTDAGTVPFTVTFPEFDTVYYQLIAENSCATASWTDETTVASLVLNDTATYTWRSDAASGNWADAGNWICSVRDDRLSYPDSASCTASFAECTDAVTVSVDGVFATKTINLAVSGLALSFIGSGTNDSRIVTSSDINLASGETLVFDSVYVRGPRTGFANNATVRLQNAAFFDSTGDTSMYQDNCRLELLSDSTMVSANGYRIRGNGNVVYIEDSTFSTTGNFNPSDNSSAMSNTVVFAGSHPKLVAYSIIPGNSGVPSSGILPVFRFDIPVSGYAAPPVSTSKEFPRNNLYGIHFEVPRAAGCFQCAGIMPVKLVDAPQGIYTERMDFTDQPRPEQTSFFFSYGKDDSRESNGKNPTGLGAEIKGSGATVILFR